MAAATAGRRETVLGGEKIAKWPMLSMPDLDSDVCPRATSACFLEG